MKTISLALVSASVLALASCGGGNKSNSSNSANGLSATEQLNTTSPLPPPGDLVNSSGNTSGPVDTNTLGTNTLGNGLNSGGNASVTTNSTTTTTNSTTK
jgi:hypothetical protein